MSVCRDNNSNTFIIIILLDPAHKSRDNISYIYDVTLRRRGLLVPCVLLSLMNFALSLHC